MSNVCKNCKWFKKLDTVFKTTHYCCRYPKWYEMNQYEMKYHYCGEFKERDGE